MRVLPGSLLGVAALTLASVAPASSESLRDALAAAYSINPTLRAERLALRVTDELVPQALSGWRPTIRANSSIGKQSFDQSSRNSGVNGPYALGLTIDQPLYRGGRTIAATRGAEAQVFAGRERLRGVEQAVLLAAVVAYVDVLRDQAILELTRNNERVLANQLQASKDRFEVGEVTITDVAQSRARLIGAGSDRVQAEGDLIESRAEYRRVIGSAPRSLEAPPDLTDIPESEEEAKSIALSGNPDLLAAQFDLAVADHGVDQTTGGLLPTLSLNGQLNRAGDAKSGRNRSDSASIVALLSVPIYQSGSVWSLARASRAVRGQRRVQVEESRLAVLKAVTSSWEALQTAGARIDSETAKVLANEVALEGVREEANVGARTVLDILDAEQELLEAQVALTRVERDEQVAAFQLKQATGRLSARHLGLSVDLYDPSKHHDAVRDKWFGFGDEPD